MKALVAMTVGTASLFTTGVAFAQSANRMNGGGGMGGHGWMGGGFGGIWVQILLIVVLVGFVAWFVKQDRK